MAESRQQLSRFAAIFAGGTMASRLLGLARDILLFALIPTGPLGAFFFAFKFPNMLRDMLGEGAANAALVPVFAEEREKAAPEAYRATVRAVMGAMLLIFAGLTALGMLIVPAIPAVLEMLRPFTGAAPRDPEQLALTINLTWWLLPYFLFIGMTAFAMAPLFVARHYATPSWAPVLLNLALIGACLGLRDAFPNPAQALVAGVWAGGIAQCAAMFWAMRRHTGVLLPRFAPRHPGVARVFVLLGPVVLGQAAGEVNKLVDNFFALALGPEIVSALFCANRLVQLPLAIFGVAVAVAILPGIAGAGKQGDAAAIRGALMHGLRQSSFLVLPAAVGLLLLGEPIVRLLFERGEFSPADTERAATALFYYALGLPAFAWIKVSVQGFFAVQDTRRPVIVASACMLLNVLLNFALVGPLGFRGLALSTSIAFGVNFLLLYALLFARFGPLWDRAFLLAIARMLLAAGVMGAAARALAHRVEWSLGIETLAARFATVALPIALALGVYFAICAAFRLDETRILLRLVRRR